MDAEHDLSDMAPFAEELETLVQKHVDLGACPGCMGRTAMKVLGASVVAKALRKQGEDELADEISRATSKALREIVSSGAKHVH